MVAVVSIEHLLTVVLTAVPGELVGTRPLIVINIRLLDELSVLRFEW